MVDVATLAVKVDTTDLSKGIASLKAFAAEGKKSGVAIQKAGVQARQASTLFGRVGSGAKKAGSAMLGAGGNARMFSMQLSQVAQQGAATGNFLQALIIQIPDLALGFGAVGIAAGAAIPIIYGLVQGLMGAGEEIRTLDETIDDLSSAVDAYSSAAAEARAPTSELSEEYGHLAGAARDAKEAISEFARIEAINELQATVEAISTQFGSLETIVGDMGETLQDGMVEATRVVQKELGVTREQAADIVQAFDQLGQTSGPDEAAAALANVREIIIEAVGGTEELEGATLEVVSAIAEAENTALSFASVDMSSNIWGAVDAANALSAALARAIALQPITPMMMDEDAAMSQQVLPTSDMRDRQRDAVENFNRIMTPPASRGGSRGGSRRRSGGGGISDAEREAQRLHNERLREAQRITDDVRTATEKYNDELADLNELYSLGYLDAEAYGRATAQLTEAFEAVKFEVLLDGIESVADAMASAIVNGENMGEALGAVFRQIAQDLISSGIKGLLMDIFGFGGGGSKGGGIGGFFKNLLSFDGGGYTGDGSRSGGIDGKGGYMAMLHPQETVVDHTKGQSMASPEVSVNPIIVYDMREVGNYLRGPEGERAVVEVMQRNGLAR